MIYQVVDSWCAGLAGIIASASTATVALHQEVQTMHYLQQFHKNYTETRKLKYTLIKKF